MPVHLCIAGIVARITCPCRALRAIIRDRYAPFLVHDTHPSVTITLERQPRASSNPLQVDRVGTGWKIEREDFRASGNGRASVFTAAVMANRYALDSLLRVLFTIIGLRRGFLLVHAAGTIVGDTAFVFPGVSGRGKSTITRLLGRTHALSDELVILSAGRNILAHPTPFWGELTRPRHTARLPATRLGSLCFIEHARAIAAQRLPRGAAFARLMATVLFFSANTAAMAKIMALGDRITRSVPGYAFGFPRVAPQAALRRALGAL